MFQSTLPRRERPSATGYKGASEAFQSTLPRRERPNGHCHRHRSSGFNPRSHAGSDGKYRERLITLQEVSIHAPTQGATEDTGKESNTEGVSIHAPTQGATPPVCPPGGYPEVSIHAPTQGATIKNINKIKKYVCFNPRSHAGSDNCFFSVSGSDDGFNPRSHAGSDHE